MAAEEPTEKSLLASFLEQDPRDPDLEITKKELLGTMHFTYVCSFSKRSGLWVWVWVSFIVLISGSLLPAGLLRLPRHVVGQLPEHGAARERRAQRARDHLETGPRTRCPCKKQNGPVRCRNGCLKQKCPL